MNKYKEYMSRIRVDEKQHERFVNALKEEGPSREEPARKKFVPARIFRIAGIAAAAVFAVVLLFGGPLRKNYSTTDMMPVPTVQDATKAAMQETQAGSVADEKNTFEEVSGTKVNMYNSAEDGFGPNDNINYSATMEDNIKIPEPVLTGQDAHVYGMVKDGVWQYKLLTEEMTGILNGLIARGVLKEPQKEATAEASVVFPAADGAAMILYEGRFFVPDLGSAGETEKEQLEKIYAFFGTKLAE